MKYQTQMINVNLDSSSNNAADLWKINSTKRIISKFVEITTKTITNYEDGSNKEVIEKDCHTFQY